MSGKPNGYWRVAATNTTDEKPARIAMIGAAWWAQGWHLPQLHNNPNVELAAIVQRSEQPTAAAYLHTELESKTQLKERYKGVPMYSTVDELLADKETLDKIDGVIICTGHSVHAEMGLKFIEQRKHILMEKPMTVDVAEARQLASVAATLQDKCFMVNNSANYRDHCFEAREIIEAGKLGEIHHVMCYMYSPLIGLFDDPANESWVKPTGTMVQSDGSGNGFGWGQLSHLLGWVLFVGGLNVEEVTAMTHRSDKSGADLTDAALIRCSKGCSISLSGSTCWPGNAHGEVPTGKQFDVKMFGSKGVLMYGGEDLKPDSGRLELRLHDGTIEIKEGFYMENLEQGGTGIESLQQFVNACRGKEYKIGADHDVGLEAVRVLDALYRSAASGKTEKAL